MFHRTRGRDRANHRTGALLQCAEQRKDLFGVQTKWMEEHETERQGVRGRSKVGVAGNDVGIKFFRMKSSRDRQLNVVIFSKSS